MGVAIFVCFLFFLAQGDLLVAGWSMSSSTCALASRLSACCGGGCHASESDAVRHDLWVSGAGTLGSLVAAQFRSAYPEARIIAETSSTARHAALSGLGVECRVRSERERERDCEGSARNVVVAFPPSAATDYVAEVAQACRLWAGPESGGKLLLASSTGVFGDPDGVTVDEDSPTDAGPRAQRILDAEKKVLEAGGKVVRLAGLYAKDRGAHVYWLRQAAEGKTIEGNADGIVNLVHYEDAASFFVKALQTCFDEDVLLAVDDEPLSRSEICAAAIESGLFGDAPLPQFAAKMGPTGKKCENKKSRSILGWVPKYRSFKEFMKSAKE